MSTIQPKNTSYGLSQAIINNAPQPVSAKRAPLTSDFMQVGTVWCNTTTNTVYILASITNNSANWQAVGGGGAGVFSSLTVTPGPINLTGTTNIIGLTNINVAGTANTNIGNATGSVDIEGDVTLTDGNLELAVGDIILTGGGADVIVPAGGSFQFAATAYILAGNGDPNGTVAALKGSIYLNTAGSGTGNRMYINTDGINAWTAVTTAT